MSLSWPYKDPDEILDYNLNWLDRLAGDTITGSTWIVPTGLVEDSSSFQDTSTEIWLSGGVLGEKYGVQNRVTTAGGRTFDQTVTLLIKTR